MEGPAGRYVEGVTERWLKVAPLSNPAMLEMFRDRDASPLRRQVPWAGEFAGKYLTAAVQVCRVHSDPELREFIGRFVRRLTGLQAEDGYLGPWPEDCRLTNFTPYIGEDGMQTWDTWGHYHVMMGLMLWHEESGDEEALEAARGIADLICEKYLGEKSPRLVETGSTDKNLAPAHSLALLYRRTGEKRYLDMARQIVREFAAEGEEGPLAGNYLNAALAGKAFYETPRPRWESLHSIMALAELHRITGEAQYREAAERLWWSMVEFDRHNGGGFTSGERATGNPYDPGAIETCCTIAWMAFSVEMLKLTGDSIIADELELSTLNSVVGMHSSTGRWATYDTPMNGVRRASAHSIVFQAREGRPELNCCSVNSPRGFGLISEWALMRDGDGYVLNWYGPSTLSAEPSGESGLSISQKTDYPLSGDIRLCVESNADAEQCLKLRIPHWSENTEVVVDGEAVGGVAPGTYLGIRRNWKSGRVIEIHLDMSLHFWSGERECEGRASIYRGPILLACDHRYNLHLAPEERWARGQEEWRQPPEYLDDVLSMDAAQMEGRPVEWDDWLPPMLLLEFEGAGGEPVRLCDYGSAGEAGTPYFTWLPLRNVPQVEFSRTNPLRSGRAGDCAV